MPQWACRARDIALTQPRPPSVCFKQSMHGRMCARVIVS